MSILRKKHGGAHGLTHEKQQITITGSREEEYKNPRSLLIEKNTVGNVLHIQDGGQLSEISDGQIQQLLGSDQNLASFKAETTLAANPEWIRSALDQLGPIFTVSTGKNDKTLTGNEIRTEGISTHFLDGTGVVNLVEGDTTNTKPMSSTKESTLRQGKLNILTKVVPKNNAFVTATKVGTSLEGGRYESLNNQQVAGLDDLQDVTNLDESSTDILPSAIELTSMVEDQSGALISPQELAMLPNKALDFDGTDATKSTLDDTTGELDNFVSGFGNEDLLDSELTYLDQDGVGNVNLDIFKNSKTGSSKVDKTDKDGSSLDPPTATISISTDKNSNTTQILINTGHGQQLFQINTADLAQATTALEPLALQGGMVGFDSNGQVLNTGTVNGITVQDGYLLIPVSQTDGQSGVLLQTTTLQQGDGDGNDSSPGSRKLYICEQNGCGKVFEKFSKLKVHHMIHSGERPFKCNVPKCEWAFMTAYKLKRHLESHENKKDFVCRIDNCGRKFTTIYNLKSHVKLHQRPKTEKCELCGEMFSTVRKLDSHLVNDHRDAERLFKCTEKGCDKKFFSAHTLQAHINIHLKKRQFVCEFEGCEKVFDKQCRLKQHMRTHTGEKPYICNAEGCGWAFPTASKLKRHQQKHTGERKWVCPHEDCDKSFMRAEHLKGHLVTHTGEKPFACTVPGCEAKFAAKSSMYVHVKKHEQQLRDGKVTYFCPMEGCERKYNNKNTLRQHIFKHYQDTMTQAQTIGVPPVIQTSEEALMSASDATNTLSAAGGNTISADGTPSINPADLINVVGTDATSTGSTSTAPDLVTNSTAVTQFVLSSELNQQMQQQQQHSLLSQNPRSLLTNNALLNSSAGVFTTTSSVVDSQPVITITPGEIDNTEVLQGTTGGSARTDTYSNQMLSDRARRRRKLLREKAHTSSQGVRDEVLTAAAEYPTSEMLTSRGLPIRDPDTGALYVQTQLLQDDPPNVDMYSEEPVDPVISRSDTADTNTTLADVVNPSLCAIPMDQSELGDDLSLDVPPDLEPSAADFSGSTIDLHNLE